MARKADFIKPGVDEETVKNGKLSEIYRSDARTYACN